VKKLVIYLSGGLVDMVVSEEPVEVVVVDADTEGVDETEITKIDGEDRTINGVDVEVKPLHVQKIFDLL
jgi:hypothetical protein